MRHKASVTTRKLREVLVRLVGDLSSDRGCAVCHGRAPLDSRGTEAGPVRHGDDCTYVLAVEALDATRGE